MVSMEDFTMDGREHPKTGKPWVLTHTLNVSNSGIPFGKLRVLQWKITITR